MVPLQDLVKFYQWNPTHVDVKKYHQLKAEGLVYIRRHPQYPIFLLNYTPRTQFRNKWSKELILARGLVIGEDGKILARPLPKFFNHYEISEWSQFPHQEEDCYELYEKMDGSLAIMFHYENHRIFCTRGSFVSEQAVKAQQIFTAKYKHVKMNKECTYCFEVIYPQNKIVVVYEDIEDLFLISITHTTSGKEIAIDSAGFKTVERIQTQGISFAQWLEYDLPNKEGYVMKFKNGLNNPLRVKIKFDTYVKKHKGKSVSTKAIKRSMKKMESINLDNIPDECFEEVKEIKSQMENEFECKKRKIESEYETIIKQNNTTRDVIEAIKQSEYQSILFAIHGKKPYELLVWKSL